MKITHNDVVKEILITLGLITFFSVFAAPTIVKHFKDTEKLNRIYDHSKIVLLKQGDTLDKFAKQYVNDCNCSINYIVVREKIEEENNLENSTIYAGQKLEIPIYRGEN